MEQIPATICFGSVPFENWEMLRGAALICWCSFWVEKEGKKVLAGSSVTHLRSSVAQSSLWVTCLKMYFVKTLFIDCICHHICWMFYPFFFTLNIPWMGRYRGTQGSCLDQLCRSFLSCFPLEPCSSSIIVLVSFHCCFIWYTQPKASWTADNNCFQHR